MPYMLVIYDFITILIGAILFYKFFLYQKSCNKPLLFGGLFIFIIYICGVTFYTGFGTLFDFLVYGIDARRNLSPLGYDLVTYHYFLNIFLLIPFGILMPLLFSSCRTFIRVFVSGFGLSLAIELSQLVNPRISDVDDLIMNTLGALIGYILYKLLFKDYSLIQSHKFYEPLLFIIFLLLSHALLYNASGFTRLFYGF